MQEIKVHVVDRGRKYLYLRYVDPVTGKAIEKSSKSTTQKDAAKAAGKWEDELREGRYKAPSKVTWADFRTQYGDEVLPGLADNTDGKVAAVFEAVERIINPEKLAALTAGKISQFVKVFRCEEMTVQRNELVADEKGRKRRVKKSKTITVKRSESSVQSYLATLKSALNWAQRVGLLHVVPNIDMPKRAKGSKLMKGRPVTGEEFDRMVSAAEKVRPEDSADWQRFMRGLWLSGLRLEEAINLWWDSDAGLAVDLIGRRPMLRIPAEHEKGHQDRLLPIAPEFAEMLLAVPQLDRTGRVFRLPFTRKDSVSKTVCKIGETANVVVDRKGAKVKYASAHDLRRSFGERWAARVMPQILMQLMRHESIETTMRYYVGKNAETAADVLYDAVAREKVTQTVTPAVSDQAAST